MTNDVATQKSDAAHESDSHHDASAPDTKTSRTKKADSKGNSGEVAPRGGLLAMLGLPPSAKKGRDRMTATAGQRAEGTGWMR